MRLEVDICSEQANNLGRQILVHAVGECRPVDAIINPRQVTSGNHGRLGVVEGTGDRVKCRWRGALDQPPCIVDGERGDMLRAMIERETDKPDLLAALQKTDANDIALDETIGLHEGGQCLADILGLVGGITGCRHQGGDRLRSARRQNVVGILRRHRGDDLRLGQAHVFLDDARRDARGDIQPGVLGVEAAWVDVIERGNLAVAVCQHRSVRPDILLDFVEGHLADQRFVRGAGEGGRFQNDLGLDVGTIERAGSAGDGRGRIIGGENRQRIEPRIALLAGIGGGQHHLHMREGQFADHLPLPVLEDGGHVEDCLVDRPSGDLRHEDTGASGGFLRLCCRRIWRGHREGFCRDRQLLATIKGSKQRHTHEYAGGNPGQEGTREPTQRDLTAIGCAKAIRKDRRLATERTDKVAVCRHAVLLSGAEARGLRLLVDWITSFLSHVLAGAVKSPADPP